MRQQSEYGFVKVGAFKFISILLVSGIVLAMAHRRFTTSNPQLSPESSTAHPGNVVAATAPDIQSAAQGSIRLTATGTPSIKTDKSVYSEPPAPPLPRAGGKFLDPTFGTEIMRVTDEAGGGNAGTSYSYWPTLNCNNTKLLVMREGHNSGVVYDFNPVTFTLGASFSLPPLQGSGLAIRGEDAIWSATNPDLLYGHLDGGTKVYAFKVSTRTFNQVADLRSSIGAGQYLFQMSMSDDADVFAGNRRRSSDYGEAGYVAYRVSTGKAVWLSSNAVNEVKIDKSGRYLYVNTNDQGPGKVEGIVIDTATAVTTNLTDDAPGQAPSHYDVGTNLVVGNANYLPSITARRMSAPNVFRKLFETLLLPNYGGFHLSLLADDESWVLVSFYGSHSSGIMQDELVQIKTDGSGQFRRLLHHHSTYTTYFDSPRANISRDGRFIAFTSNWGGRKRRDLFVARIEPAPASRPRRAGTLGR